MSEVLWDAITAKREPEKAFEDALRTPGFSHGKIQERKQNSMSPTCHYCNESMDYVTSDLVSNNRYNVTYECPTCRNQKRIIEIIPANTPQEIATPKKKGHPILGAIGLVVALVVAATASDNSKKK